MKISLSPKPWYAFEAQFSIIYLEFLVIENVILLFTVVVIGWYEKGIFGPLIRLDEIFSA